MPMHRLDFKRLAYLATAVICLCSTAALALTSLGSLVGASSPYYLAPGNGQPDGTIVIEPDGNADATGRTYVPLSSLTGSTALIITTWQSNIESSATGTFTPVNATALNFNIYDRGIYKCANPVLGTAINPPGTATNSANCQIADSLISAGTYNNIIVAPFAIGSTLCSNWVPSGAILYQRIIALMNGLKARGLTPATGFTGDVWILAHGGESDNQLGTARATLATCIRAFAQAFTDQGLTNFRFFVPTESMIAGVTSATVTGAQADAVASGCATCRQGANVDSISAANRQSPGTHMTGTSVATLAALDVAVITNCKNTSC